MRGKIISCGCAKLKMMRVANLQHGASNTREWLSWKEMRRRCFNPTRPAYPNYGGRGITVCERWSDFSLFLSDMGPCPDGLTLERRDNSKGYEADNCHWASRTEQNRNTRRCIYVVYQGKRLALSAACEMAGVRYSRVYDRIKVLGWPIERALVGAAYA
jgi:hypothetical protein